LTFAILHIKLIKVSENVEIVFSMDFFSRGIIRSRAWQQF